MTRGAVVTGVTHLIKVDNVEVDVQNLITVKCVFACVRVKTHPCVSPYLLRAAGGVWRMDQPNRWSPWASDPAEKHGNSLKVVIEPKMLWLMESNDDVAPQLDSTGNLTNSTRKMKRSQQKHQGLMDKRPGQTLDLSHSCSFLSLSDKLWSNLLGRFTNEMYHWNLPMTPLCLHRSLWLCLTITQKPFQTWSLWSELPFLH